MTNEKNNTGYRNTGYRNTGDGNTGDLNTGYGNTGDGNTGYRNTGEEAIKENKKPTVKELRCEIEKENLKQQCRRFKSIALRQAEIIKELLTY